MYPQWTYTQKIRLNCHKVHVTVLASVKCVLICTSSLVLERKKMSTKNVCRECWKVKKYGLSFTRNDLDTVLVPNWLNDMVEIVSS